MTKKEFIWLGIRAIGVYWLIHFLYSIVMPLGPMIFLMLWDFNVVEQAHYTGTWIVFLLNIPVPIILTIYFLFFGKLIYRLISHFTQGQPTDYMQAAHRSEIIVRFTGLCTLGMMLNSLYASIITVLQSTLVIYFNYPERNFSITQCKL